MEEQLLNEFMILLKSKERKEINKWKDKNEYWTETSIYTAKLCNDIDVIFNLSGNEIMEYVDFLDDEDPFNKDVKWKNAKKKKQFFSNF